MHKQINHPQKQNSYKRQDPDTQYPSVHDIQQYEKNKKY